jgi:hypothetical protein
MREASHNLALSGYSGHCMALSEVRVLFQAVDTPVTIL